MDLAREHEISRYLRCYDVDINVMNCYGNLYTTLRVYQTPFLQRRSSVGPLGELRLSEQPPQLSSSLVATLFTTVQCHKYLSTGLSGDGFTTRPRTRRASCERSLRTT